MKTLYLLFCLLAAPVWAVQAQNDVNQQQIKQQLNNYLWDAARAGDGSMIDSFIAARYDLNAQDEHGYTAVILAAYHGHQTAVEHLLNAGADPCLRDKHGNTALMGAIFKGELKIARRLIAAKCNPDTRNNAGQTAAMYAALFQQHALLKQLKAKGADMHATDVNGNSVDALARGKINGH
ncbi:ankyrin repeat domain-containing protein [Erwinia psidii]|uniref:Ankyrin repeat domain-containing protein n=1 Tax=Erwinia psidii TaxID=69224 RepID=A0A3N6SLA2_9GAMM|nr:ankyrin repeat domain-containing protein [Erwinia psidii]MCX8957852.1 ankyrin repeat domain-containing protein [Erwinia psidii]MCX8960903.1 ankyrin repeat domain-containing protein [Erwinia psidii]MCX8964857.1 ankyrin repeat domain-containing protein [Erwinia psidii]RQM38466.1 ankyrin repeat domain-containing protein [Erwinia psidii]